MQVRIQAASPACSSEVLSAFTVWADFSVCTDWLLAPVSNAVARVGWCLGWTDDPPSAGHRGQVLDNRTVSEAGCSINVELTEPCAQIAMQAVTQTYGV